MRKKNLSVYDIQRELAEASHPISINALSVLLREEGFARLVRAFYVQVPGDEVLGPMYPAHDLAGAEERLRVDAAGSSVGDTGCLLPGGPSRGTRGTGRTHGESNPLVQRRRPR